MTSTFKMLIKESINRFRFFNFTKVLTKSILQLATSLSNILHITILSVSALGAWDGLRYFIVALPKPSI